MIEKLREEFKPWFNDISDDLLEKVVESQVKLNYNKNEILCKQGGFATHVLFLTHGLIKIYKEHFDKNLILNFVKPGDFIGLSSLYNKEIFEYSAASIDNSTVYSININTIKLLIKESPSFAERIIQQLNKNSTQFFTRVISLTQKQLHGRIADAILHLSRDIYEADKFNMLLTRRDLAEFCGMSTESAIRILKEFHNDKIVNIEGKNLEIKSFKLLERLSEVG